MRSLVPQSLSVQQRAVRQISNRTRFARSIICKPGSAKPRVIAASSKMSEIQRFDVGPRLSEMAIYNGVCYLAGQVSGKTSGRTAL